MTQVPILDLSGEVELYGKEIMQAVEQTIRSTQFILGPEVGAFEGEVAKYLGCKHAIGLNSGTDALVIGLRALGVKPGDEVITTPFTFFATAEAISIIGATPVFVDIDPETYNIDASLIEKKITSRTKAIIPVHLFGLACDMGQIMALAKKHNLLVLEDVAQAFGADYQGKKVGTIGDVGAYSFFPSKNLGCYGDGGLLTTDNDAMAQEARKLRAHGSIKKYHNETVGYNSRLDSIQAAILRVKLKHIEEFNANRRATAHYYSDKLASIPGVIAPKEHQLGKHVYHQYTMRVLNGKRDHVAAYLNKAGVSTMIYYPIPVDRLPVYANMKKECPISEQLASEVLSLPIWPQPIPKDTLDRVVGLIAESLR